MSGPHLNNPSDTNALQGGGSPLSSASTSALSPFTCPTDTFGNSYLSSTCKASGRSVVVCSPQGQSPNAWVSDEGQGLEHLVSPDGEILRTRTLEERNQANGERSHRRALSKMKDYAIANNLTMMWTLTYAGDNRPTWSDRSRVVADVNAFMRKWRADVGHDFPYLYVFEQHKSGHLHIHLIVPYLFFPHSRLLELWGHGGANFSKRAKGSTRRDRLRLVGYLTKYIAKQIDDNHQAYDHRYEVARGFSPIREVRRFASLGEAFWFHDLNGYELVWSSSELDEWHAPPIYSFLNNYG